MARFDTAFDASGVEPTAAHEVLPAGKYRAQIVESEMRVTRNGMGRYLWLMLDIVEGQHRGRKIFDQLNLVNANPTTVEIAQRTLSAICRAVNVLRPRDSVELHNLPLVVSVAIKNREDNGEPTNTIKGYAKRDTGVAPQRPMAAASGGTPPWKR